MIKIYHMYSQNFQRVKINIIKIYNGHYSELNFKIQIIIKWIINKMILFWQKCFGVFIFSFSHILICNFLYYLVSQHLHFCHFRKILIQNENILKITIKFFNEKFFPLLWVFLVIYSYTHLKHFVRCILCI